MFDNKFYQYRPKVCPAIEEIMEVTKETDRNTKRQRKKRERERVRECVRASNFSGLGKFMILFLNSQ